MIIAVGVIACCINLLYKKHIKSKPAKKSIYNNKVTKKLCFAKEVIRGTKNSEEFFDLIVSDNIKKLGLIYHYCKQRENQKL